MINMWNRIPLAERKLIGGAVVYVVASGAFVITGHGRLGFMVDSGIAGAALVRYFTDNIERFLGTAEQAEVPNK